jgi:hemerythrin-like domain-containing protein
MTCQCTNLLIQDHKIILRALDVLEHMAVEADKGVLLDPNDVEAFVRFLRMFADDYHQTKEESALFPVLMRTEEGQMPALRHMLFEHDQERSLVTGLEDALRGRKGTDFVHYATRLIALLRNHIRKEDTILFDNVESALSKNDDLEVVAEFGHFRVDPTLFAELHRLEWKYLRKSA